MKAYFVHYNVVTSVITNNEVASISKKQKVLKVEN